MTDNQAKELARALYFELPPDLAVRRAESLQGLADSFDAHRIISWYMNHPMLSAGAVAEYIKEELDLES
jgi:hypothetical protein